MGGEVSPYGLELGIGYPHAGPDALIAALSAARPAWAAAGPLTRAAVCLEILARINARSHEFANAVMHTTGQAYAMAFQAGGPHAQDRGPGGRRLRVRRADPAAGERRLDQAAGQAGPAGDDQGVHRRPARPRRC